MKDKYDNDLKLGEKYIYPEGSKSIRKWEPFICMMKHGEIKFVSIHGNFNLSEGLGKNLVCITDHMPYTTYICNACLESENVYSSMPCYYRVPEFLGKPDPDKLACPISHEECEWTEKKQ